MATSTDALSSKELLEAQTHLWNHIFAFINSLSLKCAVELGIADAVHSKGNSITLNELAAALSIPPVRVPNLQRLLTLLVHNGFFTQTTVPSSGEYVYGLNTNSAILVKANGGASIAPFIELALDKPIFDAWQTLSSWFQTAEPSTAFEKCFGVYLFDSVAKMPDWGNNMRDGLGSDSGLVAKVLIKEHGGLLKGVKTLVEVGGGMGGGGGLAVEIAKAFPEIKCTVLDHSHMVNIVEKKEGVEYVGGDLFEHIPPADALILKWVLMVWNDEECVKILKRCKDAVPSKKKGGKVIIIEKVLDISNKVDPKLVETLLDIDLQVMVHTTGKLRDESEWKKLFIEAGFNEYKITLGLGMRSIIELYY